MIYEYIDTELSIRSLQIWAGLGLGVIFGIAAQITRFCLRRAVAGDNGPDGSAGAVWLMALAVGVASVAFATAAGLIDVSGHRLLSSSVPIVAIATGGLLFGAGMVLTRGCASRLTVLAGTGNLRAIFVLIVFAITAHAALKGALSPVRTTLASLTVDLPVASLADIQAVAPLIAAALVGAAILLARKFNAAPRDMVLGGVIGFAAASSWVATSVVFFDEFEPLPVQSLAFTLPWADTLFWSIASTAVPMGFGTGFIGGILIGSFASATVRGELSLTSFENGPQTLRYVSGAGLMGLGGVLAGGCTVGAGLSGGALLSIAAIIALFAIVVGAVVTQRVLSWSPTTIRSVAA